MANLILTFNARRRPSFLGLAVTSMMLFLSMVNGDLCSDPGQMTIFSMNIYEPIDSI